MLIQREMESEPSLLGVDSRSDGPRLDGTDRRRGWWARHSAEPAIGLKEDQVGWSRYSYWLWHKARVAKRNWLGKESITTRFGRLRRTVW